jgi:hypothetical protein
MADDVKATPKFDKGVVIQDVSWLGARLREKSTYAGLAIAVSLVAPHFAGASDLVTALSDIGIGVGLLIAIFLPEKGSPVGVFKWPGLSMIAALVATAVLASLLSRPASADPINALLLAKQPPLAAKSPSSPLQALNNCGYYYGINTLGGAGSVNGGAPGASVIQGAVGGTIGYGCSIGATPGNFVFVEGNFDWANLNGATSGLALTGPAHFEERFGLGSPLASLLPSAFNLSSSQIPADPLLPAGVTAGPSYPFMFFSLHEQDVSAQLGLASNQEWLFSPGFGIGLESTWSNGIIVEPAVQYVLQSSGLQVGPAKASLGNAIEASVTLKYPFKF